MDHSRKMKRPKRLQPLLTLRNARYEGGRRVPSRRSACMMSSSLAPRKPSQPMAAASGDRSLSGSAAISGSRRNISLLQAARNSCQGNVAVTVTSSCVWTWRLAG